MDSRVAGRTLWAGLLVALGFSLMAPTTARAQGDSTHYQTLQLGERSRGMAAAYTAFAADGAAIWFNPAALPLLEAKLLQGSLSLVQIRKVNFKGAVVSEGPDGPGSPNQVEDFRLKSSPSLPGFAVVSFALGKRKAELGNAKPFQVALSAFSLYRSTLGGDIDFQDSLGRTNSLQIYQRDISTYFAGAIGHRVSRAFSWGVTLLANRRQLEHIETTSLAQGGTADPSQGSPCPSSPTLPFCILNARQLNRNTVFQMDAWNLTARIGLLGLVGERWRLGVVFEPPGIRAGGKADLRFELSDVRPDNYPNKPGLSDSVFANVKSAAHSPLPWKLRFGASYVVTQKMIVAADFQLVGPIGNGSIAPSIPQLEGRANSSGILLVDSTKRDVTWNVSLGSEIRFRKFYFTRFGFLTDNSSAPASSGRAAFARPAQVNRYGFSTAFGAAKNGRGLSVGVSYLFGKGTANGTDFTPQAIVTRTAFTRVPATEKILIISVGGDVGKTAKLVGAKVGERQSRQRSDDEEMERRGPRKSPEG